MNKRTIAAFDFDGTLTTRDTFPEFIRFACGWKKSLWGLLILSPQLVLMKLHMLPNWKVKQRVFSYFFKGWDYSRFKSAGVAFASRIEAMRNDNIIRQMEEHIGLGHTVYVITGSILEWVQPWCETVGVNAVIATEIEIDSHGVITGCFKTRNCYGQEKVNRLLELEPARESYLLYAYGNSRGDDELLAMADNSNKIA